MSSSIVISERGDKFREIIDRYEERYSYLGVSRWLENCFFFYQQNLSRNDSEIGVGSFRRRLEGLRKSLTISEGDFEMQNLAHTH